MGKLLQRLQDPARSGVYRAERADEVLDAARAGNPLISRISLGGVRDKGELLARVSSALRFPDWFGRNWDALEDCLTDLSWLKANGHVLLIDEVGSLSADDFGVFRDVLSSSAQYWAGRGKSFFVVFVNGPTSLPQLFQQRSA